MQDQKSLTLHQRSFSGGGSDIITRVLAHKGRQYIEYGLKSMHSVLSVHDARPKIVDALVALIFRRR